MKLFTTRAIRALMLTASAVGANRIHENFQKDKTKERLTQKALGLPAFKSGQQNFVQLESVKKMVSHHIDASLAGEDVKTYLTEDEATLELAEKIVEEFAEKKSLSAREKEYFRNLILDTKEDNSQQKGSLPVLISQIEGSKFEELHQQHLKAVANGGKKKMLCIGGPAAVDQALLVAAIPEISATTNVSYIGAGHWLSNLVNSALQVHARHGNALNADDALTGHSLLPTLISRNIVRLAAGGRLETEDAIENPSYRKIHIKFTLDQEKLGIYLGNEGNWLKQKFVKNILGQKDQHDLNREESVISAKIMHSLQETLSASLGREFKIIEGNKRENPISSSIHVALTQQEVDETQVENQHLTEINIGSVALTRERIEKLFGKNSEILAAFSYQGDGHIVPEYHGQAQSFVENQGQEWTEPACVKRILLQGDESGVASVAGVVLEEEGVERFVAADSLHFTGGYMSRLVFDDPSVSDKTTLPEALSSPTTVSTGLSMNVILKRNQVTDSFLEEFGNTGQLAVTNSHWTMLAATDEHVVLRVTGGGNTGSEEYNPNYFLNTLVNTGRIFRGETGENPVIGVIRTYGCPRSINSINATIFEKLAEGLVVSYGKGGTGNTKRFSEAAIALSELGFEREVVEYFNHNSKQKLGTEISKMIASFKNEWAFFRDFSDTTEKKMGYKEPSIFDYEKRDPGDISGDLTLHEIEIALKGNPSTAVRNAKIKVSQGREMS